ncbi:uncharacterized protein LOC135958793 [Calliphora vicina]|uniref:uncharacterized protein LOC135958793 n=1 Tax=Calliphora vicina TaxID=7373 RepID=UPI00325BFEB1
MLNKRKLEPLTPTKQILKCSQQLNCQIPLNSMEKCQYKSCQTDKHKEMPEIKCKHLEKIDKYWSEFLKAQQESTANYVYKLQIFGNAKDPTLVKKEPVSWESINQRVLHMPFVGGLLKSDMFYLLSFLLNLMKVSPQKQQEYMEYLQDQGFLNGELLNYLEMMARQPNAGLNDKQLKEFQQILQNLRARVNGCDKLNYFNAEHIFLKSINEINPYELEYLNSVLLNSGKLNSQQFMYLARFVDRLQAMDSNKREQYLKALQNKKILPFSRFETLLAFMLSKAKRFEQLKLKLLLKELLTIMDLGPCVEDTQPPTKVKSQPLAIHIDYNVIDKALYHLMRTRIPNIVRVTELKNFLKDLMLVHADQIVENLINLKSSNVLTTERLKYIEHFIVSGKLGKVERDKKKFLLKLIQKVAELPLNPAGVVTNLVIPASKGPINEKSDVQASKTNEIVTEPAKTYEDGTKHESNERQSRKSAKRASKNSKKKAGKKKK